MAGSVSGVGFCRNCTVPACESSLWATDQVAASACLRFVKQRVRCSLCASEAVSVDSHCTRGQCYACDKRTLMERIYVCSESSCRHPIHVLKDVLWYNNPIECSACLVESGGLFFSFSHCDHHFGIDCFRSYVESSLNNHRIQFDETRDLYSLQCPMHCAESLVSEIESLRLVGLSNYQRFKEFATELFLSLHGGIFCPLARCGTGIVGPLPAGQRYITCPSLQCARTFCRSCLLEVSECGCGSNASRRSIVAPVGSKLCPFCSSPVTHYRDDGCHHIGYGIGGCQGRNPDGSLCGRDWCYVCLSEWPGRFCQQDHWFCDDRCGCPEGPEFTS